MKKAILITIIATVAIVLNSGNWGWAKKLDATDMVRAWDMAYSPFIDAIWVGGQFTGTMSFGGQQYPGVGEPDVYVAKYSLDGQEQWFRNFGSPEEDVCFSIASGYNDSGNCCFTGYFNGTLSADDVSLTSNGMWDTFLGKLDVNGNLLWIKSFGGPLNDIGYGLAVDSQDYVVVTGWFAGTIDFGNGVVLSSYGGSDMFVARFDPQGNCLWARHGGGIGVDYGFKVDVDLDGRIYCTGTASAGANFDGMFQQFSGLYLAVYDAHGTILRHTSAQNANPINIGVSKTGGRVLLTGRVTGDAVFDGVSYSSLSETDDAFLAEYSFAQDRWTDVQIIGGKGSDKGRAVYVHELYGYSLAASFEYTMVYQDQTAISEGSWDCVLIREFDTAAISYFGSINTDVISDVVRVDGFREISCGWYSGSMSLGNIMLDSDSDADQNAFVVCYDFSATAVEEELSLELSGLMCYPNPFRDRVHIEAKNSLPAGLAVYNLKGQQVKALQPSSRNTFSWDGCEQSGTKCPAGVYLIRGQMRHEVQKVLLCR